MGGFIGNFLIYYGAPTQTETVHPPVWVGLMVAVVSPITVAVVTFALCGFANFSSIAIQMAVVILLGQLIQPAGTAV